jgi:hypothetical protein
VTDHKFKIGRLVNYLGRDRAFGVYQITQLLPQKARRSNIALRTSTSPMSAWLKRVNFARCDLH